ncbi:alpha/beta fold hydrolase [Teredinibacter sp. KSP-S5-2]|uniref:alpha/beta fold hydrolase n=1 Tax=Teredinibacter sp. KSP-S5-2 TaxID=3034506 RepID=UPI002934DE13|nr:alpha/beta fold hydrolase [Teredinibacter sp. KSP-S5-2]WNO09383.1 alpha/beta fold hydrolase [Teredinibacter sp. KSP-S5-2]
MQKVSEHWYTQGSEHNPAIVFLHGFLGDPTDWQYVAKHLTNQYYCLFVDLPSFEECSNIGDYAERLFSSLPLKNPFHLIGYSLGSRIAMHWLQQNPAQLHRVVLEAGHPGLKNAEQKKQRETNDAIWQQRFEQEPLAVSLTQWYQQPVFSAADADTIKSKATRLEGRQTHIGRLLKQTSLGNQQDLWPTLTRCDNPVLYVSGGLDTKYSDIGQQLAQYNSNIVHKCIEESGHNCHNFAPEIFAQFTIHFLTS